MAKVDIKSAAATAEIVASIAVVVTLLFVVSSIDQNTAALQSINDNFLYEIQVQRLSDASTDNELASIIFKFEAGHELNEVEELRYRFWSASELMLWEVAYIRYHAGLLPPKQWKTWNDMWTVDMPKQIPEERWSQIRYSYDDDFVEHVDAVYSRE